MPAGLDPALTVGRQTQSVTKPTLASAEVDISAPWGRSHRAPRSPAGGHTASRFADSAPSAPR